MLTFDQAAAEVHDRVFYLDGEPRLRFGGFSWASSEGTPDVLDYIDAAYSLEDGSERVTVRTYGPSSRLGTGRSLSPLLDHIANVAAYAVGLERAHEARHQSSESAVDPHDFAAQFSLSVWWDQVLGVSVCWPDGQTINPRDFVRSNADRRPPQRKSSLST